MKYFKIIFLCSFCSVFITPALLSHDNQAKHSLLDSAHIIANISPRYDELLGQTIELGRMLANPSNIDFISWAEYLGKDIGMGVALGSGGIYCSTQYPFIKQLLLTVATTVGATIGLTASLSYTMLKYKRWQFNRNITYFKQLITQSTNQADLLTAYELMCRYLSEVSLLSLGHDKNTAVKECAAWLRDIIDTLHHRISELKKEES